MDSSESDVPTKHLDFSFNGRTAGYFLELADYPTVPGRYRYMQYRSVGHYELGTAWQKAKSAVCTFVTAEGPVSIRTRFGGEPGTLYIDKVSRVDR